MIVELLAIIAMLLGTSVSDLKSDNPADYLEYDEAKQIWYDEEAKKDGGIGTGTLGS